MITENWKHIVATAMVISRVIMPVNVLFCCLSSESFTEVVVNRMHDNILYSTPSIFILTIMTHLLTYFFTFIIQKKVTIYLVYKKIETM